MSTERKGSTILATALMLGGLLLLLLGQRVFLTEPQHGAATYAGLLLVAVAVVLRAVAFGKARGDARGVEGRLLAAYGGVCLSLLLYALSTPLVTEALGFSNQTIEKLGGPLYVLWTAVLLLALLSILFIEIVYLRMPIPESVELRRVRTSVQAGLSLGCTIVFLLCINYVATERDVRKDVSYFRTTEPSSATRGLVSKLDKPMHVVLFYPQASDVLEQVKPYFDSLQRSNPKLSYEVTDVALTPELASKYRVRENGNVLLISGDRSKPKDKAQADKPKDDKDDKADPAKPEQKPAPKAEEAKGESFRIGNELTESRATLKKLDSTFQQTFTKLVRPERTLYLTVGHGEHNAKATEQNTEDGTTTLNEVLRRLNLKTQDLGIAQGLGSAIPSNASAVLVVGPTQKFVAEEVESLLAYARKGGRLFLMLDPDQDTGLAPLLAGLGLEMLPGTAASAVNHMARNRNESDNGIIFSNRYSSHPTVTTVSRHQREVASVFVNGGAFKQLTVKDEPKPKVTFPLRSDPQFWRDLDGNFRRDPQESMETLNLMGAVEFAAPAGSTKPEGKKDDPNEGRAVVLGDGDFMTNKVAAFNGNLLLFVDSLAWLIGNEDLSGETSSEEDVAIPHTNERDKVWFYGCTFAIPVPIALAGVWVTRRRRRRAESK